MEFDTSFEVPLPPAEAWAVLMDVRRVAACLPGAELTEVVDDRTFKGNVGVRLGPVALTFTGIAQFTELDAAAQKAAIKASGTDAKGRGGAQALVGFRIQPVAAGSKVLVHTNLSLSGAVAQYGRGVGMIQDVANQLVKQFAQRLKAEIAKSEAPAATAVETLPPPAAKPIFGFSLFVSALWSWLRRTLLGQAS